MNFWEHQDDARRRTTRLIILYAVLLAALALAGGYAVDIICQAFLDEGLYPGFVPRTFLSPRPYVFALGFVAVTGVLCLLSPASLSAGGKSVAEGLKGTLVAPQTADLGERRLLNVVEEMALASGIPVPPVYILANEPGINAFAAGGTINDAVIGVTQGTVDLLTREELQAVIGHEFSHIINGDVRLDLRFVQLLFGLMCLSDFCVTIIHGVSRGARFRRNSKDGGKAIIFLLLIMAVVYLTGAVMAFVGSIIQAAVNRQREFLADASSVQFTRSAALASALKKIGGLSHGSKLANTDMTSSYRHLFFCSIHSSLFATHPPLETRIRRLDPQWDGRYPEMGDTDVRLTDTAREDISEQRSASGDAWLNRVRKGFVSGEMSAKSDREPPTGREAEVLLQEACRDPLDASMMVLGLLLDAKPAIRAKQLESIEGKEARQAVRTYSEAFFSLPRETYVPFIELAIPALKNFSRNQFETFLRQIITFIDADGSFSFKEWILHQLIITQVGVQYERNSEYARPGSKDVHEAAATVLSAFAKLTPGGQDCARAYAAGARHMKLTVPFISRSLSPEKLSRSVDILAGQSDKTRERFMHAATTIVTHDNKVDPEETMFLRVLSLCLGIPVPPVDTRNDLWEKYRSK